MYVISGNLLSRARRHTGTPAIACPTINADSDDKAFDARSLEVMPPFAIRNEGRILRPLTISTKKDETLLLISKLVSSLDPVLSSRLVNITTSFPDESQASVCLLISPEFA